MANNLSSNVTREVKRVFLPAFENERVVSKTVDTQMLQGSFKPSSGSTVDFKRPHDYASYRNATGDLTSAPDQDIEAGKATGTVQDFFTCYVDWNILEEAIELDQLDMILEPMAQRIVTDCEVDFSEYLLKNLNLSVGDPDTAVDAWGDVAEACALMDSVGIPKNDRYYVMNPYVQTTLANLVQGLEAGSRGDVAWETAVFRKAAGFNCLTSSALASFTTPAMADLAGAVNGAPDATYVTAKDTMTQSITFDAFGSGSETVKAGTIIEFTDALRLNLATREQISRQGVGVKYRAVVNADFALTTGAGTGVMAGAAINESGGQYNTVATAIADNEVATILNASSATFQPNLFYQKKCAGIGSVRLPKLFSTDTAFRTKDGMVIRISEYADGTKNENKVRFDFLPAYATFNPFFGGQGHGLV